MLQLSNKLDYPEKVTHTHMIYIQWWKLLWKWNPGENKRSTWRVLGEKLYFSTVFGQSCTQTSFRLSSFMPSWFMLWVPAFPVNSNIFSIFPFFIDKKPISWCQPSPLRHGFPVYHERTRSQHFWDRINSLNVWFRFWEQMCEASLWNVTAVWKEKNEGCRSSMSTLRVLERSHTSAEIEVCNLKFHWKVIQYFIIW